MGQGLALEEAEDSALLVAGAGCSTGPYRDGRRKRADARARQGEGSGALRQPSVLGRHFRHRLIRDFDFSVTRAADLNSPRRGRNLVGVSHGCYRCCPRTGAQRKCRAAAPRLHTGIIARGAQLCTSHGLIKTEAAGKVCISFARLLHQALLYQDASSPWQSMVALESITFSPSETNDLR